MEYKLQEFDIQLNVSRLSYVSYFEFTKNFHTKANSHPFRELLFVDSGSLRVESDNFNGVLSENSILIHKPNENHALYCDMENAPNVLIIGFECKNEALDRFAKTPFALSQNLVNLLTNIVRESRSVYLPPYDLPYAKGMKKRKNFLFGADQMLKAYLEIFLIDCVRASEFIGSNNLNNTTIKKLDNNARAGEVYQYLVDNFAVNHTLDEISFLFNTNKTYLCSEFKAIYGETILSFIHRMRIKEAKKLLRTNSYTLTQIAEMVGYSSVSYFSKVFKKYENKNASEYMKTIKMRLEI